MRAASMPSVCSISMMSLDTVRVKSTSGWHITSSRLTPAGEFWDCQMESRVPFRFPHQGQGVVVRPGRCKGGSADVLSRQPECKVALTGSPVKRGPLLAISRLLTFRVQHPLVVGDKAAAAGVQPCALGLTQEDLGGGGQGRQEAQAVAPQPLAARHTSSAGAALQPCCPEVL